jgi:hypothetical protein
VQRRQLDEATKVLLDGVVDPDRIAQLPAVNNAMSNCVDVWCSLDRVDRMTSILTVDDVQFQARRPRVDDEDAQPGQVQSRISGGSSPCSRP